MAKKSLPAFFDIGGLPDYGAGMKQPIKSAKSDRPGLGRIMGAILYDGLALLALLMIGGFIFVPVLGHPPATQNEHLVFQVFLSVIAYLFFCWFWTHGGQTLGMRAWKIKLTTQDDAAVSWPVASSRFVLAILSWLALGLGYLWIVWDPEGLSWHDRLSGTHLTYLARQQVQDNSGSAQAD